MLKVKMLNVLSTVPNEGLGVLCLTPLSTIFSYIMSISFIDGENHRPAESHLQNLSHSVVYIE